MRTIGILGGLTWQSTLTYYYEINRLMQEFLGGENSAKMILSSVNFAELDTAQREDDMEKQLEILGQGAQALQRGGADFWLMACNTTHKLADQLVLEVELPFLHIAKVTAAEILQTGIKTVVLTGTQYTMEQNFYRKALEEEGLTVMIPNEQERNELVRIVDDELTQGIRKQSSLENFWRMAERWQKAGANGIVLGCTEIGLLVKEPMLGMPIFDTALLHSAQAVKLALGTQEELNLWDYRKGRRN